MAATITQISTPQTEAPHPKTGWLPPPWTRVLLVGFSKSLVPKAQALIDSVLEQVPVTPVKPEQVEGPGFLQANDLLLLTEQLAPGLEAVQWLRRLSQRDQITPAIILVSGPPFPPPRGLTAVDILPRKDLNSHQLARSLGYLRQSLGDERMLEDVERRLRAFGAESRQEDEQTRLLQLAGAYRAQMESYEAELAQARTRIQDLEDAGASQAALSLPQDPPLPQDFKLENRSQETPPNKIPALAARLMMAEWKCSVQVQNLQDMQARLNSFEQSFNTIAALIEAPDLDSRTDPAGLLQKVAERLVDHEKDRHRKQGTIDQLSHSLAVQVVDEALDDAQSRRNVLKRLDEALSHALKNNTPLACLLVGIDQPKLLRKTHGSVIYDYTLVQITERLKRSLRQRDTLLRYNNESFVLISDAATAAEAYHQAHRLVELAAKDPVSLGAQRIETSISVGVTLKHATTEHGSQLLHRAHEMLQESHKQGLSKISVDPLCVSREDC